MDSEKLDFRWTESRKSTYPAYEVRFRDISRIIINAPVEGGEHLTPAAFHQYRNMIPSPNMYVLSVERAGFFAL
jgi:hypothetical protein